MHDNILIPVNIQLFAEGAGDGGSQGTGVTGSVAGTQTQGVKASLADVKYGVQPKEEAPTAKVQEPKQEEIDRDAEFEKLIKGDYKEQYDARMQKTIQSRLKSSKETVDKYNSITPTLELLARKYGVDANDIDALNKAIQGDDSLFEEEAIKQGVPVEKLREFETMKLENSRMKNQMQEQERQERGRQLYQTWMQQAEQAKAFYPKFDLQAEMQNEKFVDLLRSNIDVKTAYEVLHNDEIISGAMQYTAQTVKSNIAKSMAANGARPNENGIGSQSAAVVKSDVTKLNNKDIDEVMRRVARGEKISFS